MAWSFFVQGAGIAVRASNLRFAFPLRVPLRGKVQGRRSGGPFGPLTFVGV
jgi:hypothetical protein